MHANQDKIEKDEKKALNNVGEEHFWRAEVFMIIGEVIVIILFGLFTEYHGHASPQPTDEEALAAVEDMQDRYALF
jgi:hypothetical protein